MRCFENIADNYFYFNLYSIDCSCLAQEGKDAGLGAIGGLGDTYWGKNKARSMEGNLIKFTKLLAIGFIVFAVILNLNF